ncbi:phosphonate C-P lyase system protein PhnG [Aureimonas leprariae]|uniref:Phosphonate C-P lyase system protein PhnG n=1 Tax=Plantimonas leprariae TaxID=2615207 RepID=A0A7V7PLS4_9HYPH|nr:phosphonate C-P lyase system protein PhnG [Aureimonas leprariae]KAB0677426.1 phosphonate C-P lyase system protein PhnG [Aureimonas leprariae]
MTETFEARRRVIGAMALAPAELLRSRFAAAFGDAPDAVAVRGPEVGLVMLRGRAGGGGAPFNLGEASVCRATVRLASGEVGHAMILGRDAGHARLAAHLDALWQRDDWRDRVEAEIVAPALAADAEAAGARAEETAATRVDFFTLVRGED